MSSGIVAGFNSIVIISFLLGLLLLGTAILSPRVRRHPHWYGFMVPLFAFDIIFMMGMGYQANIDPPKGFCTFQAILLYSIPGWAVVGFGCFTIHTYLEFKSLPAGGEDKSEQFSLPRRTKLLLMLIPPISFVGFLLLNGLTVMLSSKRPVASPNKYHLYCTPETNTGLYFGGAIMGVAMFMWSIIIIKAGLLLKSHHAKSKLKEGKAACHQVLFFYLRALGISITGSLILGLYIWSYARSDEDNVVLSYCLAFPSIIIFLVYGTQKDMLECWTFWRRKPEHKTGNLSPDSSSLEIHSVTTSGACENEADNLKNVGYNWNVGTWMRAG